MSIIHYVFVDELQFSNEPILSPKASNAGEVLVGDAFTKHRPRFSSYLSSCGTVDRNKSPGILLVCLL